LPEIYNLLFLPCFKPSAAVLGFSDKCIGDSPKKPIAAFFGGRFFAPFERKISLSISDIEHGQLYTK